MQYINAFVIGGLWCILGQLLIDLTKLTPARILVSMSVIGVILGSLGIYRPLIEFAGAGATVPLVGFGALLAKGVISAIAENGAIGIFTGGLSAVSGGITAVIFFSILVALLFKRGDKMT